MCVHSFAISWQTALAAAFREETQLLPGATGRFLIPELMQPPAAQAPGHSSSHNVRVSSDLPTTTWFFALERETAPYNLTRKWARRMRPGSGSFPARFFVFLASLSTIFSHLVGKEKKKKILFPPIFNPARERKWNPLFETLHLASVFSSGLWLAGGYYLKTWESDKH